MFTKIQHATIAARARTGDQFIGTSIQRGRYNIVRAVPPASGRGFYSVTTLKPGLTPEEAVAFLDAMH
jgi:hypothetical protein